jgi:competence ComEA-like helix-hairpin-helix protein
MDAPPSLPPVSGPPAAAPPAILAAWPRSAQLTTAFLLGVTATLLAGQAVRFLRWGSRPTDLERSPALTYRIDLNRADRPELLQLPGVGDAMAQRIEDYRREHGGFRNVDELMAIHGIGPATRERLRDFVEVRTERTEDAPESAKKDKATATKKSGAWTGPAIDLNRATAEDLQRLPGIGPKLAQRILDERNKAPFREVGDLRRVNGIGPKKLEQLRPCVTLSKKRDQLADAN